MKNNTSHIVSSDSSNFENWWKNVGNLMVKKLHKQYIKQNPNYDSNMPIRNNRDFVHLMYHTKNCYNLTYNFAKQAFNYGKNNYTWNLNNTNTLYCDLDKVIILAHKTGSKYGL